MDFRSISRCGFGSENRAYLSVSWGGVKYYRELDYTGSKNLIPPQIESKWTTPLAKAQGFTLADMAWNNCRRCPFMYRSTVSSSRLPTALVKYSPAQNYSPIKAHSASDTFFLSPGSFASFNLCTTPFKLSLGFGWIIRCMWSFGILSSLIRHLFIQHSSYNNFLRRMIILIRCTRRRYFGMQATSCCKRFFVLDSALYLGITTSCRNCLPLARFHLVSVRNDAFST